MRLDKAEALARTRDFGSVLPWGLEGTPTVLDFVQLYSRRAIRGAGDFSYTWDFYRESTLSRDLKRPLRLVTGYKLQPTVTPHQYIQDERKKFVPTCLLGWSVLQGPKVLRHLFFLDVKYHVYEDDLVASHLRVLAGAAAARGIQHSALAAYVASADSVQAKREQWAAETGTTVK